MEVKLFRIKKGNCATCAQIERVHETNPIPMSMAIHRQEISWSHHHHRSLWQEEHQNCFLHHLPDLPQVEGHQCLEDHQAGEDPHYHCPSDSSQREQNYFVHSKAWRMHVQVGKHPKHDKLNCRTQVDLLNQFLTSTI